jgi:hypothetical protein
VKSDAFSKTSGVQCQHCVASFGCGIHAARPQVCRDWLCGWRSLPFLDGRWKPDVCGLLVVPADADIPPEFERRIGLTLIAYRSRRDLARRFVIEMIAGLVAAHTPTFLSVPGPPGHHFAKTLVNPLIAKEAEARDGMKIEAAMLSLFDRLAKGEFEPVMI